MKRRSTIITTGCLLVAAVAILLFNPFNHQEVSSLPSLSLKTIDGKELKLRGFRGQPVLVTFWASSCSSCMKEMPQLISLYEELNTLGLEIIGIAMPYDPPNRVMETVKQKQIPYPVALDIDGNAAKAFGDVSLTPTSFLFDPNGEIIQRKTGVMDINNLRDKIVDLLSNQSLATSHKPLVANNL